MVSRSTSSPLPPISSLGPRGALRQPPSRPSSPSLSALPKHLQPLTKGLEGTADEGETRVSAGTLSDAEYERLLPAWRVWVRTKLVRSLEREMPYLEWVQVSERSREDWRELIRLRGAEDAEDPKTRCVLCAELAPGDSFGVLDLLAYDFLVRRRRDRERVSWLAA